MKRPIPVYLWDGRFSCASMPLIGRLDRPRLWQSYLASVAGAVSCRLTLARVILMRREEIEELAVSIRVLLADPDAGLNESMCGAGAGMGSLIALETVERDGSCGNFGDGPVVNAGPSGTTPAPPPMWLATATGGVTQSTSTATVRRYAEGGPSVGSNGLVPGGFFWTGRRVSRPACDSADWGWKLTLSRRTLKSGADLQDPHRSPASPPPPAPLGLQALARETVSWVTWQMPSAP